MCGIAAIFLSAASVLLGIIGLAIPYWCYGSDSDLGVDTIYFGLWESCVPISDPSIPVKDAVLCSGFENIPDAIAATRALEIIGVLLLSVALTAVILKQRNMTESMVLAKVGAVCAFAGGILMIIGVIVFATDDDVKKLKSLFNMDFHAGFALCIVAGLLALPAGIAMFKLNKIREYSLLP